MLKKNAVTVLDALSQGTRLEMMQILVSAGADGLPAGVIADRLGRLPGSITFHFRHLESAGLISQRRFGRRIVYTAECKAVDDLIAYLSEYCRTHEMQSGQTALPGPSARHESRPA